jgi:hypothetical protein
LALIEALLCLMTYLFDICDTMPYLVYASVTASCGKSTSLERHEPVCNVVSTNSSTPARRHLPAYRSFNCSMIQEQMARPLAQQTLPHRK